MIGVTSSLPSMAAGLTVAELFDERCRLVSGAPAIRQQDRTLTYAQLRGRVARLANVIAGEGLKRGERVAVLAENRHEYVEIVLACAWLGVTAACLNWRLSEAELSGCIELAAPRLTFVSERHQGLLERAGSQRRAIVIGAEYEERLARAEDSAPPFMAEPEDGLTLLFTSGTTGRAKAAIISHRALIARSMVLVADAILPPGTCYVAWSPYCHIGASDTSLATLMNGGAVIVVDGFQAEEIAEAVKTNRIGWLSLAGTVSRMTEELRRHDIPAGQVGLVGSMADLVPRADIDEITRTLNAPYLNTFGSTETGLAPASRGRIPVGNVPEKFIKQQSSLCRVQLVDETGKLVPDGEPGVLRMKGPSLFSGYLDNPEATAEAFRDGWYHMGDMFIRHPGGGLEFFGRDKYLIKSGGENIYPAEIEQLVLASPRVEEAVLIGRRDEKWGEVPILLVIARDPALQAADVETLYAGKLARYKVPKEIRFVSESDFTRSATGKVIRNEIHID
ncbi:MAG: class I adenylate-forming enzyme family protein [Flavobacteriaceae bacterium]